MNQTVLSNQLFETLNPSQREAVTYEPGHLLIVAGPGTGKTHTLIYRIGRWIEKLGPDQKVLAVTFTNKAALQLEARLEQLVGENRTRVVAGTFHRFCLHLLSQHRILTGLPDDFQLVDEMIMEEVAKALWPRFEKKERRDALNRISFYKSVYFDGKPPEDLKRYDEHLRDLHYIDFDDVILKAITLLENEKILREVQGRFPAIFVDEYQDINPAQQRLLKLLIGHDNVLTAIGDPHQAIYGFRGSDIRFFQSFREDFPGARTLYLSDNYRSAEMILTASYQVMAGSSPEVPALTANIFLRGDLVVHTTPSERAEAEYVVHQIEKLIGGTSMFSQDSRRVGTEDEAQVSFGDIAVLYRLNSMARPLKEALERSGIPYNLCGEELEQDDICPKRGIDVKLTAEKVSLMTLHASKGLEFSVVFIIGCEENILPLQLKGLKADLEEERRLFYVGMTRAKRQLYFTRVRRRFLYGKGMRNAPSRFLLDIEEQLKRYENTGQKFKRRKKEIQISLFK